MSINPLLITALGLFITVCPRPSTGAAVIGRVDGAEGNKTAWELTEALYGTSGLRSFNGTWITGSLLINPIGSTTQRLLLFFIHRTTNLYLFLFWGGYHLEHHPRWIIIFFELGINIRGIPTAGAPTLINGLIYVYYGWAIHSPYIVDHRRKELT